MRLHANARLSVKGRELLIERLRAGWSLTEAATAAGVSERNARKWRDRYQAQGAVGLLDRSSAPRSVPSRTPEDRIEVIAALRRLRFTGAEIAELLGMALSTVSGILTRIGMGKLGRLGLEPPQRYERERPGELIHIDVKKLGRIHGGAGKRITGVQRNASPRRRDRDGVDRCVIGSEYIHIAVDDAAHGITVERLLTDNGSAYRSTIHALACRALGLKHLRTRPYRPQTNGKAERFIRTLLAGWAYGAIYRSSRERTAALSGWLDHYNYRRPHGSLSHQPPVSRLQQLTGNNLLGSYS
jgi:transposase InsO family protein